MLLKMLYRNYAVDESRYENQISKNGDSELN
jgi:hypothetical protein